MNTDQVLFEVVKSELECVVDVLHVGIDFLQLLSNLFFGLRQIILLSHERVTNLL